MDSSAEYLREIPHLHKVLGALGESWPEHQAQLSRGLETLPSPVLEYGNRIAELVLKLAPEKLDKLILGYKWKCREILEEEEYFCRHERYRLSSFAEVNERVYQKADDMQKCIDGLLLSQAVWGNRLLIGNFLVTQYLQRQAQGGRHLEIGPGHGLQLYLAAQEGRFAHLEGWDISPTSLETTRNCLQRLGVEMPVELALVDFTEAHTQDKFDSVVLSEILEHLEDPQDALVKLREHLNPGARVFINVPVNSPAIDHIFLFRSPEEVVDLVKAAGFEIQETCMAPASGYSLERARRNKTTISCAVIARVS